jgi:hypothetical protein
MQGNGEDVISTKPKRIFLNGGSRNHTFCEVAIILCARKETWVILSLLQFKKNGYLGHECRAAIQERPAGFDNP